ncbi:MAG: preprotein translocase subunit SecY [Lachnospiraceae bacterium]
MFKTLRNALKIKDIRSKLLYTFLMLVVIRIGSLLPIPGVDNTYFSTLFSNAGDAFSFLDAFTGGSFLEMSVFALSITPYITSSIIMQLMTIAIPKLEEMQKEGEDGRKKIAEITRYLTVVLALIESTAMAVGFGGQGLIKGYATMSTFSFVCSIITIVVTLTAGSALLMWIGERITEKGVGNGISIVLLFNIVSRIPQDMVTLFKNFVFSKDVARGVLAAIIIIAVILAMVVFVCILQDAVRNIPVQYSQKMVGRKAAGGQQSKIPLKVNTAGVIPVIFASSLMSTPVIIAQFFSKTGAEWARYLSSSYWCNPQYPKYSIGLLVYIVLVVFFAYFYTSITFNPLEIANNMKKSGGFIPGIRPGKPTSDYLNKLLNYIVFIGACGLIIVAVVPIFFSGVFKASVSFSGTSIIIIVGVILETLKSIESQMLVRNYKGFLND